MIHGSLKLRVPTENCRTGRVRVASRGPLQPCRNGAIARRGRGRRRPALSPSLRDANAKARFSVGNNFGAHTRKTFRTDAVSDLPCERIAADSFWFGL